MYIYIYIYIYIRRLPNLCSLDLHKSGWVQAVNNLFQYLFINRLNDYISLGEIIYNNSWENIFQAYIFIYMYNATQKFKW